MACAQLARSFNFRGELAMNLPGSIITWMAICGILTWTTAPSRAQPADEKKSSVEKPKTEDKKVTGLEGKPAPDIDQAAIGLGRVMPGETELGTHLILSSLRGKNVVVLVFYPGTRNDPNSAVECRGFRDLLGQFEHNGGVVIGVSNKPLHQQIVFWGKERLNFPLYGDETRAACTEYGVLDKNGRVNRVTFVIDKKGILQKAFDVKDMKTHAQEVLDYVKTMK
jgi:thioredoxin-dependent peroxiredoxin